MQIKYRIILGYTIIVLLLLAVLCGGIYQLTKQDRIEQFNLRLLAKAKSTSQLLKTKGVGNDFLNTINNNSASLLYDKSIMVFDASGKSMYSFDQDETQPLHIPSDLLKRTKKETVIYFNTDIRDAVAFTDRTNLIPHTVIIAASDKDRLAWLKKLRGLSMISLLGGLVIFLIAGYFFAKRIAGSISSLTTKLTQISSEAFSARLSIGKEKDELQELALTINNLLDRLQSSFDTQRRFLSNASHELTTPLAAISSQLDVALQKERSNEEYKKIFLSVKDDVKRLALLVRSILEIAKASGSVGGIDLTKVRIDELLMRIPVEMKKISQLYDVKLNFEDFPDSEGYYILYGNEALLYSACRNIIHNACKFSKDKCAKVSLTYTYQNIVMEVKDDGPGISPAELENIFQPFFRGHKYENTNMIHGTGLGLALAHRIIELHKGDIYVESVVGEGSTFSIYLPVDSTKTYKK
jgi:signal transduction histidine kinase